MQIILYLFCTLPLRFCRGDDNFHVTTERSPNRELEPPTVYIYIYISPPPSPPRLLDRASVNVPPASLLTSSFLRPSLLLNFVVGPLPSPGAGTPATRGSPATCARTWVTCSSSRPCPSTRKPGPPSSRVIERRRCGTVFLISSVFERFVCLLLLLLRVFAYRALRSLALALAAVFCLVQCVLRVLCGAALGSSAFAR